MNIFTRDIFHLCEVFLTFYLYLYYYLLKRIVFCKVFLFFFFFLTWNIFKIAPKYTGTRIEIWTVKKTSILSCLNNLLTVSLRGVSAVSCFNIYSQFANTTSSLHRRRAYYSGLTCLSGQAALSLLSIQCTTRDSDVVVVAWWFEFLSIEFDAIDRFK